MNYMHFQGPGFEMEVPTDWLVTSTPQYQVMFLGPHVAGQGSLRPNLMVTIRPLANDVTVRQVADETRTMQEREYADYIIQEEIDFTERGGVGFLRRYRWHDTEHEVVISQIQSFFVFANAIFTLTATHPGTQRDAALDAIFDHMIQSFRINSRVKK